LREGAVTVMERAAAVVLMPTAPVRVSYFAGMRSSGGSHSFAISAWRRHPRWVAVRKMGLG